MQTTKAKLSYKDYEQFPDDGQRHELIDGEHVVTPAPELGHQRVLGRLYLAVHAAVQVGPGGELISGGKLESRGATAATAWWAAGRSHPTRRSRRPTSAPATSG